MSILHIHNMCGPNGGFPLCRAVLLGLFVFVYFIVAAPLTFELTLVVFCLQNLWQLNVFEENSFPLPVRFLPEVCCRFGTGWLLPEWITILFCWFYEVLVLFDRQLVTRSYDKHVYLVYKQKLYFVFSCFDVPKRFLLCGNAFKYFEIY